MNVAIFHDYFGAIGGGENVVIAMAKILNADIITTDTDAIRKIDPSVTVISLGDTAKYPGLKQVSASVKFFCCDFSRQYDFFIFSGNWAHYAAHRHHPNLWYCHTPVRAFYDRYDAFLKSQKFLRRQIFRAWTFFHRHFDQRAVAQVDAILTNSQNTKGRIERYYARSATVLYPSVDTSRFAFSGYGDFWLSVNRLYPEKRIELQVEAFRKMPDRNLVIVGGYAAGDHASSYAEHLSQNLPQNITLRGETSEQELIDLYARCRGHICTAVDEDFGITPLEAMACGKPVVAVNEGGYRETVTPETGLLVEPDPGSLVKAIRQIDKNPKRYREACERRAGEFDRGRFAGQLTTIIRQMQ